MVTLETTRRYSLNITISTPSKGSTKTDAIQLAQIAKKNRARCCYCSCAVYFNGKTDDATVLLSLMRSLFGACFLFSYGVSINNTSNQMAITTTMPDALNARRHPSKMPPPGVNRSSFI